MPPAGAERFHLTRTCQNLFPMQLTVEPAVDDAPSTFNILNGAFYSKKQREEMDKVEELHRRLNHISDERLGQMLDAGQLLNAGDLTAKSVAANRQARGDCPDCQTGKFTERPRRPSQSPAPTATMHCMGGLMRT
jgi:hypothetical protein